MCYIDFTESDNCYAVIIAKDLKLEDAIQFALNLHRSSNSKHIISVRDRDDNVVLMLSLD